jgi:hypothetical protein
MVIVADEADFTVIGEFWRLVRMRVQEDRLSGFFAPTKQQMPALQRTRARVPDQNHSPQAANFW